MFGLLGLYRRHLARPAPVARYLAGASFWVYLVHLPIVGLIQADLLGTPIPPEAKFALVLTLTLALGLASYHVLVRPTALGRLLGGRGRPGALARASGASIRGDAGAIRGRRADTPRPARPGRRRRRRG